MFDDQTIELLPARTVMSTVSYTKKKFVWNTGGAGGNGGTGGTGGNGGIAIGGTAVALNLLNVNVLGDQTNVAGADASANASGGAGGAGGAGGDGGSAG